LLVLPDESIDDALPRNHPHKQLSLIGYRKEDGGLRLVFLQSKTGVRCLAFGILQQVWTPVLHLARFRKR
jgi:hypothetical protein